MELMILRKKRKLFEIFIKLGIIYYEIYKNVMH